LTAQLRIVLTGGPGGGKTTAADFFRRELGERVVVVPEAATMLFSGGFPRLSTPGSSRAAQRAIYHVQCELEEVYADAYPDRILLCDRGTIDGAAYWPEGDGAFFDYMSSTHTDELCRYDAVVFFESAAIGGLRIEGGNAARIETIREAAELDTSLHDLWSLHDRFFHVPHCQSFFEKIRNGLDVLSGLIPS